MHRNYSKQREAGEEKGGDDDEDGGGGDSNRVEWQRAR